MGGVCRLISVSGAILCIGTVHLLYKELTASRLTVAFSGETPCCLTFDCSPVASTQPTCVARAGAGEKDHEASSGTGDMSRTKVSSRREVILRSFLYSLAHQLHVAAASSFVDGISFCYSAASYVGSVGAGVFRSWWVVGLGLQGIALFWKRWE